MALSEALLPEFDHEMGITRKTLERAPESKWGWSPHEKSMTLQRLVSHLAEIPMWAAMTINTDSLDLAPPGAPPFQPKHFDSVRDALGEFDKNVSDARATIAKASDEHLLKPWSLLMGGNTVLTMPRISVLRSFVMNHSIHHRAQLVVYLRLNDVPVPATYGPSADEGSM